MSGFVIFFYTLSQQNMLDIKRQDFKGLFFSFLIASLIMFVTFIYVVLIFSHF